MKNILLLLAVGLTFFAHAANVTSSIPVLTVREDTGLGECNKLPFSWTRDDSGRPLRVVVADDTPLGSGEEIRGSVWLAAMTAAILRNDPLDGVRLTVEFSGSVDGPSAGGVICLAILQALEGKTIPADFAMTGTIMPDGTIGLVGGVAAKVRMAIAKGKKRICIPAFCRFEEQDDGRYVDLFRICSGTGARIYPVRTIEEVLEIVNGTRADAVADEPEMKVLSLPRDVEKRILNACFRYSGNRGPVLEDEEYWLEVGEKTGFPYFHADILRENSYWSLLCRGKILAANQELMRYRSEYGDCACTNMPIFSSYWDAMTNEYAVTKCIRVGTNDWLSVKKPPYDENDRRRMIEWNKFERKLVLEFDDQMQEADPGIGTATGYHPDGNNTLVAVQGEDEAEIEAEATGFIHYYAAIVSGWKEPDKMSDRELYDAICELLGMGFRVARFVNNGLSPLLERNRRLVYEGLPEVRLGKKALQCEKMFHSAALAVAQSCEGELNDGADSANVARAALVDKIDGCDAHYPILRAAIADADVAHALVDRKSQLSNFDYHVGAALYRHSQVLAKACALQVKFAPDSAYDFDEGEIGNRQFVYFLTRMARASALRSIAACKKAGISCIDPILRVELGDEALGDKDCDLINDVLENYWRAYLGAKALTMGFQPVGNWWEGD